MNLVHCIPVDLGTQCYSDQAWLKVRYNYDMYMHSYTELVAKPSTLKKKLCIYPFPHVYVRFPTGSTGIPNRKNQLGCLHKYTSKGVVVERIIIA